MRAIIPIIFLLLTTISAMADTRPCAIAIEWWLTNQGKFQGSSISTKESPEGSNRFIITQWNVPGVNQPTDKEIEQIIEDYNVYINQKLSDDSSKASILKSKLNLNDADIKTLKGILNG